MSEAREFVSGELLDFCSHAASGFLLLVVAHLLGCIISPAGAVAIGYGMGFLREFTEWQDGGRHPFTAAGILDQVGWTYGAMFFIIIV